MDEAVRGLDVAVEDADRRRRLESVDDLQDRVDGLRDGHRRVGNDAVLERALGHQLHGDDGEALDLARAEHVHAVGMTERCRQPAFAQEARALFVVAEAAAEQLQRDAAPAVGLFRLVDLAHAALAERANDDVGAEALAGVEEERQVGGQARRRRRRERTRDAVRRPEGAEVAVARTRVVRRLAVHQRGTIQVPATRSWIPREGCSAAQTAAAANRTIGSDCASAKTTVIVWTCGPRMTSSSAAAAGSQTTIARHRARRRDARSPRRFTSAALTLRSVNPLPVTRAPITDRPAMIAHVHAIMNKAMAHRTIGVFRAWLLFALLATSLATIASAFWTSAGVRTGCFAIARSASECSPRTRFRIGKLRATAADSWTSSRRCSAM